jgi:hypothetical protein
MPKYRGHCQACLRVQAVNDKTGRLSLHGYQVAGYGYFSGTCNGSKELPLEKETKVLDQEVQALKAEAARLEKLVEKGPSVVKKVPVEVRDTVTRKRKTVYMTREEYIDYHENSKSLYGSASEAFERRAAIVLMNTEREAAYLREFADQLVESRDKIHGRDLIDVEAVNAAKPQYETEVKRFEYKTTVGSAPSLQRNDPERKRAYRAAAEFIRSLYDDETIKTKRVKRDHMKIKGPFKLRRQGQNEWDGETYAYKITYEKLKES